MAQEATGTPEHPPGKEKWLGELAEFIVEANKNTWAADGAEVEPQRPGYRELGYQRDQWLLRDSYTGYFRAPGMTTIYYKSNPVWTMAYGGHGQTEDFYPQAKETYNFLRAALMNVSPELPIRGPVEYVEGEKRYEFNMLEGDLTDGLWKEEITESGIVTFRQTGIVGLVIHKNADKQAVYPWQQA